MTYDPPNTPPPSNVPPGGPPAPPAYGYGANPYVPPYGQPPGGQLKNGLGVAGMVCGIVGVVLGWIPFVFWLGFILGILALVFGGIGRGRAGRGEANNGGQATAAIVLGAVALVFGVLSVIWTVHIAHKVNNDFDCIQNAQTQQELNDCTN
jgi:hypothetical protein